MTTPGQTDPLEDRLQWARQIAREAGEITLRHFRQPQLQVERKADRSPVTLADREAEQHLRQRILQRFPDDAILGEELGAAAGTSGLMWTLDPIDGTKSFIHGIPLYTTLVAVVEAPAGEASAAVPKIGVVRAPALDEEVFAEVGQAAWYQRGEEDPEPTRVGTTATLDEALFVTSEVKSFQKYRAPDTTDVFLELQQKCQLTRTWGDGYGYLLVATGRADLMIDPAMNLWDTAALAPIISEAGGVLCDWQGQATIHAGEAIATNAELIKQVLALTRGR